MTMAQYTPIFKIINKDENSLSSHHAASVMF